MIGRTRRTGLMSVVACAGALALAACGGGGGSKSSGNLAASRALPSFSIPTGSTTSNSNPYEPKGQPTGKIRIVNLFAPNGKPGPALDFYDMSHPAASDNPLIANLAYGDVSQYIAPRAADAGSTSSSNLYIFPAGSKTWGTAFIGMQSGGNISNAGWTTGQQRTVVMGTNNEGISGQPNPTFQEIDEETPTADQTPMLVKPAPGKGIIALNIEGFPPGSQPSPALRIDNACPDNTDPQTNKPAQASNNPDSPAVLGNGNVEDFEVTAGSHTLDVPLSGGPGMGLTQAQCRSTKAAVSKTVDVADGATIEVFLYGPRINDLRMQTATVG
jgi:hypothetical protein